MSAQVTVTAYGRAALEALRDIVADVKHDPMAPVTVLVPNNIAGIVARRHLAHGLTAGGNGVAGIWFTTLPRLAEQLAAPTLTGRGRRPATRPVSAAAIRECLDQAPGVFAVVKDHPATARALANASRQLRDVDEVALTQVASASSLSKDVARLHRQTTAALAGAWYDQTDLLTKAAQLIEGGSANIAELGTLVHYLPQDLSRAESSFAKALAAAAELRVVLGRTGSPRADLRPLTTTTSLAGTQAATDASGAHCCARSHRIGLR